LPRVEEITRDSEIWLVIGPDGTTDLDDRPPTSETLERINEPGFQELFALHIVSFLEATVSFV